MELKPCKHENICPYGVKPSVGMWAKVDNVEFWGTDCLVYIDCPRKHWKPIQWRNNPSRKK